MSHRALRHTPVSGPHRDAVTEKLYVNVVFKTDLINDLGVVNVGQRLVRLNLLWCGRCDSKRLNLKLVANLPNTMTGKVTFVWIANTVMWATMSSVNR
jgi:hypothetical protein